MSELQPIRVGILGFGVVGSGTYEVLQRNASEIVRRAGRTIQIVRIATRTPSKVKNVDASVQVDDDVQGLVNDPHIDIVVELMGGIEPAKSLILQAIQTGKHVVTANKALLAEHGNQIFAAAHQKGVMIAFEAAVAGGIPIIKALREGLTANRIHWVAGIINGTTNFILTQMRTHALSFEEALQQAQDLGYAEADPTFDIEGIDAAHKLTLLASIAYGIPIQFDKVYIEGISQVRRFDVEYANQLGYRIKLLALAKKRSQGIELRVHPTLVPQERLLASVEGAMNAVVVHGDAIGDSLYYGAGAGSEPTASAVVADLVDVVRLHTSDPEHRVPHLAFRADSLVDTPILPIEQVVSSYYLRLSVDDRPGVMADLTAILAKCNISIDSMVQEHVDQDQATIIFIIHQATEGAVNQAIDEIEQLPFVHSRVTRLRIEVFA